MEKIAIFSDIHGNLSALNAFFDDAKKCGATDYWFLGDLFGPGPDVEELWNKLKEINPSVLIRGNWDDFFINSLHQNSKVPTNIKTIERYIINHLKDPDKICQEIEQYPISTEKTINDVKIGLSHNLPYDNQGDSLSIRSSSKNLAELFTGKRKNIDIAIYAHIHHPTMRYVDLNCLNQQVTNYDYSLADERLVLNIGSIGLPFDKPTHLYKECRAEYLLLEVGDEGDVYPRLKRISYNNSPTFEKAIKNDLPFKEQYINNFEL